jgi:GTP-binding protein HflX
LIDRKGYVQYAMVGDARKIELPDFGRQRVGRERFRGLRFIHTHLQGESLTQDDLTDLALLRLDLIAAIAVDNKTGLPGKIHTAHLLPAKNSNGDFFDNDSDSDFAFVDYQSAAQTDVDFLELIESLEAEISRQTLAKSARAGGPEKVLLVSVTTGSILEAEESLLELAELARSAGVIVLDKLIQRRTNIDPKTLLGRGKLEELLVRSMRLGADMIVFDSELTASQVRAISEATDLKVIDRSQLILDIFAQRAQSREGKLQVELAQLRYILPRLVLGQNSAYSRLAGGIGGRGPGETKLETDRRRVRDRIALLENEVNKLRAQRGERRKSRYRRHLPIISLVGYTNAGKSTLLNALTHSDVLAENRLFATLDPTSRRLRIPVDQEVIINDTVGFIRDLPEDLIAAFKATLEEIEQSDLLVFVVDASDPRALQQFSAVRNIVNSLEFGRIPAIVALNKSDIADPSQSEALERQIMLDSGFQSVRISALHKNTLHRLINLISEHLSKVVVKEDLAMAGN